jgi:predicted  nucleic acid-binding Zn-ribbon protein
MERSTERMLEHKLHDLEKKLVILINLKEKLSWSVSELQRENAELKSSHDKLREEIRDLRKKNATFEKGFNKSKTFTKIAFSKLTPTSGIAELRDSVEKYIQEIDKCIALLEETL